MDIRSIVVHLDRLDNEMRMRLEDCRRMILSLGSTVPPGSESALRSSSSDKPPFTSRADSEIPERGDSPSVLWIESLERKLQHVRIALFAPEYLAQHQEFTDEDQALLIDELLALKERQSVGGPPTPDLAAQPDSTTKTFQTVKTDIPGSCPNCRRFQGGVNWVCVKCGRGIEGFGSPAGGPPTPDLAAQPDDDDDDPLKWILRRILLAKLEPAITKAWQPAGGPPIQDLAAQPDSTTEELKAYDSAYQTINRMERYRIGVYDYNSLVACLRSNFQMLFPTDTARDPQDMIQFMAAELQELRRQLWGKDA